MTHELMKRRFGAGLAACAIALASCGDNARRSTEEPGRYSETCEGLRATGTLALSAGGIERTAAIHMAPATARRAGPLLIALHGYTGTGTELSQLPGLTDAIDDAGFVAAFPNGMRGQWHFPGYAYGNVDPAGTRQDRQFFERLLDRLTALDCVDPERVYFVGYSMGGGMASELSCRHADRIAGVGIVAGEHFELPCGKAQPVAVMSLHAVDDPVLPYAGGRVAETAEDFPRVRPIRDVVAAWAARNLCERDPRPIERPAATLRFSWAGCAQPLVHLRIARGGHSWFGVDERRSGVSATRELLAFFDDARRRRVAVDKATPSP